MRGIGARTPPPRRNQSWWGARSSAASPPLKLISIICPDARARRAAAGGIPRGRAQWCDDRAVCGTADVARPPARRSMGWGRPTPQRPKAEFPPGWRRPSRAGCGAGTRGRGVCGAEAGAAAVQLPPSRQGPLRVTGGEGRRKGAATLQRRFCAAQAGARGWQRRFPPLPPPGGQPCPRVPWATHHQSFW